MAAVIKSEETAGLLPAKIDFSTEKTQLAVASVVAGVTALAVTVPGVIRMALDEHMWAVMVPRVDFGGFFAEVLKHAPGAGFGPLAALLLEINTSLAQRSPLVLAIGTCLLLVISAVLVVQVTAQICSCFNRHNTLSAAAGAWAGILFAVSPMHSLVFPMTILGGVHPYDRATSMWEATLLITCLSLGTLACYLRFRLLREAAYFKGALVLFLLCALTGVQAFVVPPVLVLAELLLFPKDELPAERRAFFVASFWMVAFFVFTIAPLSPQLFFGPPGDWLRGYAIDQFLGRAIESGFAKPIVPHWFWLGYAVLALLVPPLIALALRVGRGTLHWRPLLWLSLWLLLVFVAEQRFDVALESQAALGFEAPAAMLIALAAIPAADVITPSSLKPFLGPGAAALTGLAILYGWILSLVPTVIWTQ